VLKTGLFELSNSNETGYRYLGQKWQLIILTKLGIAIEANEWSKAWICPE